MQEPTEEEKKIESLKTELEQLDEQFRKSKRKIAALNLDNEIKDRKISELEDQ